MNGRRPPLGLWALAVILVAGVLAVTEPASAAPLRDIAELSQAETEEQPTETAPDQPDEELGEEIPEETDEEPPEAQGTPGERPSAPATRREQPLGSAPNALPRSGTDALPPLLAGTVLLAAGALLRRRLRPASR